jgi:AcrR family transcriptional regulator
MPATEVAPKRRRRVGRPPGPSVDPEVRRQALLDAAATVIRRDGPKASMDDLAAEAGLTKPVLYAHFGDRAGLADALAERFSLELVERLSVSVAARTPRDLIRGATEAFVGFVSEDPNVYDFLVRESAVVARGANRSIARLPVFDLLGRAVTLVVTYQLEQGGGDTSRAEAIAFAVMGMIFTSAEWWLDRASLSREELIELLSDMFWKGLSAQGFGAA